MILGIGCDLVNLKRIEEIYFKYTNKFINKILTDNEVSQILLKINKSQFVANVTDKMEIEKQNILNIRKKKHTEQILPGVEFQKSSCNIVISYLAKRYAAKEAYAKALGVGIGSIISFKDIEVLNNKEGRPYYSDNTKSIYENSIIHLSISDDYPIVIAYAIIEKL